MGHYKDKEKKKVDDEQKMQRKQKAKKEALARQQREEEMKTVVHEDVDMSNGVTFADTLVNMSEKENLSNSTGAFQQPPSFAVSSSSSPNVPVPGTVQLSGIPPETAVVATFRDVTTSVSDANMLRGGIVCLKSTRYRGWLPRLIYLNEDLSRICWRRLDVDSSVVPSWAELITPAR